MEQFKKSKILILFLLLIGLQKYQILAESNSTLREIKLSGAEQLSDDDLGEFAGLFSQIVLNEVQVYKKKVCTNSCGDILSDSVYHEFNVEGYSSNKYYPKIDCVGKIHDCGWIGTTTICDQPSGSLKRYEWLQTSNGRYGPEGSCQSGSEQTLEASYYQFSTCDNCLCTCVQESAESKSIRTFNLRPQVSDVKNNMVVVGVKFTEKDKMIHLQIQQGKLLPGGEIEKESEEWVELEDFVYLDNVTDGGFSLANGESLTRGTDFTFITSEQDEINLDDIQVNSSYITGVRLNHEEEGDYNSRVQLEVQATTFDWDKGELDQNEDASSWFNADETPVYLPEYLYSPRTFYECSGSRGDPKESTMNDKTSNANQYTKFDSSNGWRDAGMFTLPVFDLRPVAATPSAPLEGVGMYVKHGGEDCSYILALKVFAK